MITQRKWENAQRVERGHHTMSRESGLIMYQDSYMNYFFYLGIESDLKGKTVAEVGPADFPALHFCMNIGNSFIVEPMESEILKSFNIPIMSTMAEKVDFSECDEVWLFNVLQHTKEPEKIVSRAKKGRIVRYFEPINYETDDAHLHNFTLKDFEGWFGNALYYPPNQNAINFHTHECAYGIYNAKL